MQTEETASEQAQTAAEERRNRIIRGEVDHAVRSYMAENHTFPSTDHLTRALDFSADEISGAVCIGNYIGTTPFAHILTKDVDYAIYKAAINGSVTAMRLWHQIQHGYGQKIEHEDNSPPTQFVVNLLNGMPGKDKGEAPDTDFDPEQDRDAEDNDYEDADLEDKVAGHMAALTDYLKNEKEEAEAPGNRPCVSVDPLNQGTIAADIQSGPASAGNIESETIAVSDPASNQGNSSAISASSNPSVPKVLVSDCASAHTTGGNNTKTASGFAESLNNPTTGTLSNSQISRNNQTGDFSNPGLTSGKAASAPNPASDKYPSNKASFFNRRATKVHKHQKSQGHHPFYTKLNKHSPRRFG
ncbi:MAG: hypothetical protein V4543_07865 [Bacteroidota bacterium]